MRKLILAALFLLPLFLLGNGVALYYSGIKDFSTPLCGIYVLFDTDLGRLRTLADVRLNFELWKGNLQAHLDEKDAIKYINLDIDEVKLEYGYLKHPDIRYGVFEKENWILRIYNSYIFFGPNFGIFTSIAPFIFDVKGNGNWKVGLDLTTENLGLSLLHGNSCYICFQFRVYNFAIGIYENPFFVFEADNFYMGYELNDNTLKGFSFFKFKDGYIKIGSNGTEFTKKVGRCYVLGKISKESQKIALGIELGFQF
ncbi:MAG: hypothetical protein J7L34_07570 [Thermotogaceae bacterium]|nr:hypothetical protein [Thermotogaceae bacterium]